MTTTAQISDQLDGTAPQERGATVWLTGLPSAGKTTIAMALAERLRAQGHRIDLLDGDEVRRGLTSDLGFSREDRDTNVRRIGFVAGLLARHGVKVLVPVIAPYRDSHTCSERDVKGLYAKQRAVQLSGLTGIDDPYEEPLSPELRLDTSNRSLPDTVTAVHAALAERGLA